MAGLIGAPLCPVEGYGTMRQDQLERADPEE